MAAPYVALVGDDGQVFKIRNRYVVAFVAQFVRDDAGAIGTGALGTRPNKRSAVSAAI